METSSTWQGCQRLDFFFEGRHALLVSPPAAAPGAPWAEYTEYFGAFPDTALALLARGYRLAFVENRHRWGCEEDYRLKFDFGRHLTQAHGLSPRATLLGMSLGGLIAVHVAARYPESVEALYLDAPVMNLLSCPLGLGVAALDPQLRDECLEVLGATVSELLSFRGNPLDEIPRLISARIPAILVYGEGDSLVPYAENGALLERAYRAAGCPVEVFAKPGCGHHPHGLPDPAPVVEILECWRNAP